MILRSPAVACLLALLLASAAAPDSAKVPTKDPVRRLDPPAGPGAVGPNVARAEDRLLLSWLEPANSGARPGEGTYLLRYTFLERARWSEPQTIVSSDRIVANWADFPSVVLSSGGWLLAHWSEWLGSERHAYDVQLARSDGPGKPWRRVGTAHDDRTETEHGFVSFVPEKDAVRAFWLDGRETKTRPGGSHGHGGGPMMLRSALVTDRVASGEILDPKVCDCCQTSAAMTSEGAVIVYRDRSDQEVRDISIVRRRAGGWTAPAPVAADRWTLDGCPVNGPAVAADARTVAAGWFTGEGDRPRVQLAFSADAGATFGSPLLVDDEKPLGRVALALSRADAYVCWVATAGKSPSIRLRRFSPDGSRGRQVIIAETTTARSSGFPRLGLAGDSLVVAWVEASDPARLRAAIIDPASLR